MDYDICRNCSNFYQCTCSVKHLIKLIPDWCNDFISIRLIATRLPNNLKKMFFKCFEIVSCNYQIEHIVSDFNSSMDYDEINQIKKKLERIEFNTILMERDQIYNKILIDDLCDMLEEDEKAMMNDLLAAMMQQAIMIKY